MAASYLIAGLAAPLGPPLSGFALDATSPTLTFAVLAAVTAVVTVAIHLSKAIRTP